MSNRRGLPLAGNGRVILPLPPALNLSLLRHLNSIVDFIAVPFQEDGGVDGCSMGCCVDWQGVLSHVLVLLGLVHISRNQRTSWLPAPEFA